ncbi:PREDICTED: putative two-component response regulator ARR21 [Erythranthe guttata]|uniref:putative two-component response regulator ARR21 n=1 Tax=Erythranthe guttata TaxID=4155 RepID=UPI00064D7F56|nr:PREDICTED: putative two-component response regulator ARR21 [Erythranthe guttata]|eukprot:XP_012849617.1 PREDICTED: putative two-component response regulator ARR21 [Erythranthe guttata]
MKNQQFTSGSSFDLSAQMTSFVHSSSSSDDSDTFSDCECSNDNLTCSRMSNGYDIDGFRSRDCLKSLIQSCLDSNQEGLTMLDHKSMSENLSNYTLSVENCPNGKSTLEKQQPQVSFGQGSASFSFASPSNNVVFNSGKLETKKNKKTRVKWTRELHDKFTRCVELLGGSKSKLYRDGDATPKGILNLMKCDGLTIFHVKSHLQKYRVAQFVIDLLVNEFAADAMQHVDTKRSVQIEEALRQQRDFQKLLCKQLENQKKLQLRIEEQAKQLRAMIECQFRTKRDF